MLNEKLNYSNEIGWLHIFEELSRHVGRGNQNREQ